MMETVVFTRATGLMPSGRVPNRTLTPSSSSSVMSWTAVKVMISVFMLSPVSNCSKVMDGGRLKSASSAVPSLSVAKGMTTLCPGSALRTTVTPTVSPSATDCSSTMKLTLGAQLLPLLWGSSQRGGLGKDAGDRVDPVEPVGVQAYSQIAYRGQFGQEGGDVGEVALQVVVMDGHGCSGW